LNRNLPKASVDINQKPISLVFGSTRAFVVPNNNEHNSPLPLKLGREITHLFVKEGVSFLEVMEHLKKNQLEASIKICNFKDLEVASSLSVITRAYRQGIASFLFQQALIPPAS
jgi:hypothetical protein